MNDSMRGSLHDVFCAARDQATPIMAGGLAQQRHEPADAGFFGQDRFGKGWAALDEADREKTVELAREFLIAPTVCGAWNNRAVPGPETALTDHPTRRDIESTGVDGVRVACEAAGLGAAELFHDLGPDAQLVLRACAVLDRSSVSLVAAAALVESSARAADVFADLAAGAGAGSWTTNSTSRPTCGLSCRGWRV